MGVYAQVLAALQVDDHADRLSPLFLSILITVNLVLYLYFTYAGFNTGIRVIIVSTSISVISGYGAFALIPRSFPERRDAFHRIELIVLFFMGMATASLRRKNNQLQNDKRRF